MTMGAICRHRAELCVPTSIQSVVKCVLWYSTGLTVGNQEKRDLPLKGRWRRRWFFSEFPVERLIDRVQVQGGIKIKRLAKDPEKKTENENSRRNKAGCLKEWTAKTKQEIKCEVPGWS